MQRYEPLLIINKSEPISSGKWREVAEQLSKSVEIDFTQKWEKSDVVLKTQDSEELLHVNKTFLAIHSPYFNALFFGKFAESTQENVAIGISYWAMLEILELLHQVDKKFGPKSKKQYEPQQLVELYQAGDSCDVPLIRGFCIQQLTQLDNVDALDVAVQLGFHEIKTEILKEMSCSEVDAYLRKGAEGLVFSTADASAILQIIRIRPTCTNCKTHIYVAPNYCTNCQMCTPT